jgi:acyl-CoA synthetase (NDP forming)
MTSPARTGLAALLDPGSVAVIGASEATGNRGGTAIRLLRKFGYAGAVYPVHPRAQAVEGYPGYASLDELPATPEVALVGVGAATAVSVVPQLAKAGVGAAIVWAGGFAENGREGAALQRRLTADAAEHGVRLLGPNCLGVVNCATGFTGTFASWLTRAPSLLGGRISMVSQSGGLAASAHSWSQAAGVGFRYMISTGNEADVGIVEVLEFLAADPGTDVVCAYLEGVADGRRLLAALRTARDNGKQVVALKGGRSAASTQAIAAHTGALAGQARIWDAVLARAGAIQVFSLEEMVEVAALLVSSAGKPLPAGRRVVVLSYGGGQGVLAADQAHEAGLEVPPLSAPTRDALAPLVPPIASTGNPIDLTPEAFNQDQWRARFPDVLRRLDDSGEADAFLLQMGAMNKGADETAAAVAELHRRTDRMVVLNCRAFPQSAAQILRDAGVHVFTDQARAVTTLGRLAEAGVAGSAADDPLAAAARAARREVHVEHLPAAVDGQVYAEHEVHELLSAWGFATVRGGVAHTGAQAAALASDIGGPVAMKVVSSEITHRAEAGLLRLGVTASDASDAYADLAAATRRLGVGEGDYGVYVQEMAAPGVELFVSAFRDPTFGPMVSVGAGGNLAELLDDIAFAPAPFDEDVAARLLRSLRIAQRKPGPDLGGWGAAATAFVAAFSRLAAELPWARYVLELNPVSVRSDGALPLDGLLIVEEAETSRD